MGKIFISYSHKDRQWVEEWLLPKLEGAGLDVCIDFRDFKIGRASVSNMEEAVKTCDRTILVLSPQWVNSHWTNFEALMLQTKDPINLNERILPLMLEKCELPDRLSIFTSADFTDEGKWESELSRLLKQISVTDPLVSTDDKKTARRAIKSFSGGPGHLRCGERNVHGGDTSHEASYAVLALQMPPHAVGFFKKAPLEGPEHISISKLPNTGDRFFGREEELKELDAAWADDHTHIVTLIAWGGVGKSTLVNQWLNFMECKNYCGAQKVYGWSFYSQGAEEGKQASADEFMQETLKWFGDANPGEGSAVDKGRRLARLVQNQKTLLILDGMEPLQYPPGQVQGFDGQLKDQGLKTFLKELSAGHPGLCVITSRESVTDLSHKKGYALKERELEHLSIEAGRQLLKDLGVIGTDKEVIKAVEEYKGHALALTLLGRYIKGVYDGDIRKRDTIPRITGERSKGPHARRVMAAYERWLGDSPELNVLRIMGLFDRPVEKGAVDALRAEPGIPGVTDKLQELGEEEWQWALDHLRNANLLARKDQQRLGVLDCHPLVREHFGEKLKRENEEGWKQAHKRLYHYYKGLPEKELPDTLGEMEPLFAAVAHGCSAGLYMEAEREVYWKRIRRGKEAYTLHKLGAFGSDLAMLSHFFEKPWTQPASGLDEHVKALVLSWAAFGLRAVGRLHEAIQPMKATIKRYEEIQDSKEIAIAAGNLSELMLTLGNVAEAVTYARDSVTHADRSGDDFLKESFRTTLADALHQAGQLQEAEQWFQEAEAMHKKRRAEYPYLYSLQGYRYCDLLLGQGKYTAVMERAEAAIKIAKRNNWLLDISLDHLSLGRAGLMKSLKENSRDVTRALSYLDRAVTGLREAGYQYYIPLALFARAECFRSMNQYAKAWDDLNEAFEIAEAGGMKLFLCDFHLEAGRLCQAQGKEEEAGEHFRIAKEMIKETGYLRRKSEVGNS